MTTRIHFVRHGETTANAARVIAGASDVMLTDAGRAQAQALSSTVGATVFDYVWSSDLTRAIDTARLAGHEPTPDPRVREMDFGALEGQPWGDVLEKRKDALKSFADFVAPGGESVVQLRDRVYDFADGLGAGHHVVFCHGGVIRVALAKLGFHVFVPNCAVVGVDWSGGRLLGDPLTTIDLGGAA